MKNEDNTTIFDIYYKDLDIYMLIITPLERRNFDSEYKKLIAKDVCNDPDHTKFLDNDVSFTYKFFDLNFNMMFEYKINLDLCKEVNFSLKDGYLQLKDRKGELIAIDFIKIFKYLFIFKIYFS